MDAKNVIIPIQRWLLSGGWCPSCGGSLNSLEKRKIDGHLIAKCSCSRSFEYNPKKNDYERVYLSVSD